METVIKVKGITRRWIFNTMLTIATSVLVAIVAFGFFIYSYYCNLAKSTADSYARFFTGLSYSTLDKFTDNAHDYIERFEQKDLMRVQIIDNSGNVVADTDGYITQNLSMPDYYTAQNSDNDTGSFRGKLDTGERIMAQTFLLSDVGNGTNGAVRWIISMKPIYYKFAFSLGLAIIFGAIIIIITLYSGRYFNKSIVVPVREVSSTARRIAMGDFKARLEVKESDEIGELCDTINYMAGELHNAEEMKNDFISSVSHELRTPLTAIKGWGETVKQAVGNDDELVDKGIGVILSEADRLQGLVEELLDFSRIQSGRLSVDMAKIDLAGILDESCEMYDEIARRNGILLKITRPYTLPLVLGDINKLKQVFINIIDNAVKYTVSDGYVDVLVTVEEGFIRIVVKDTGVGIPEKDIERVKEKFYKANKNIRGSGIGLAVADEILKQHNGLLFVESKENEGTTVTIVLPQAEEETQENPTEVEIKPTELNVAPESEQNI